MIIIYRECRTHGNFKSLSLHQERFPHLDIGLWSNEQLYPLLELLKLQSRNQNRLPFKSSLSRRSERENPGFTECMVLHINTMEGKPVPFWVLWATWPEAMLMHSYLALRVENKRWTAKIWGQQTQLSGRDLADLRTAALKTLQPILVGSFALYPILSLSFFLPLFVCLP